MKSIVNGFIITIDMYSKIPMPKVERNKKNMKYALCFVPIIGLIIGALLYGWGDICTNYGFGQVCFALVGTVIPIIITGGIHLTGLMNTADALHSHGVIAAICFSLLYGAGLILIWKVDQLLLLGLSYIISRTLSGMSPVWFPIAGKEGDSYSLSSMAHKTTVRVVLTMLLAICFISAIMIQPLIGVLMALASMWVWTYYYYMSRKQFGGITEDVTGYFLCLCELSNALIIGFVGRVM